MAFRGHGFKIFVDYVEINDEAVIVESHYVQDWKREFSLLETKMLNKIAPDFNNE